MAWSTNPVSDESWYFTIIVYSFFFLSTSRYRFPDSFSNLYLTRLCYHTSWSTITSSLGYFGFYI